MKKIAITLALATLMVGGFTASGLGKDKPKPTNPVTTAPGKSNPKNKVTLCHATGSAKNPYVRITVDANGAISGHAKHERDIIPPFDYNDKEKVKTFPGLNWDAKGQATFNNGCNVPSTTPGTTTGTTTTTPTKTVTTPTTTVTTPGTTVTTPGTTTTVSGSTATVTTVVVVTKPRKKPVVLPKPPTKVKVKPSAFPYTP